MRAITMRRKLVSFGVIVNERTAPAAQGAPVDTSQAFVTGRSPRAPAGTEPVRAVDR